MSLLFLPIYYDIFIANSQEQEVVWHLHYILCVLCVASCFLWLQTAHLPCARSKILTVLSRHTAIIIFKQISDDWCSRYYSILPYRHDHQLFVCCCFFVTQINNICNIPSTTFFINIDSLLSGIHSKIERVISI